VRVRVARRRRDRGVGQQALLQLLAPDHRNPGRQQRRQPLHGRRSQLDPVHPERPLPRGIADAALSRLRLGGERPDRRVHADPPALLPHRPPALRGQQGHGAFSG